MEIDNNFSVILEFLKDNPSFRAGKNTSTYDDKYINSIKQKYLKAKNKESSFSQSNTKPDKAVSLILETVFEYDQDKLMEITKTHKESMIAENMVGDLLEGYIETKLDSLGWVRCHGNIVKAVDFIKRKDDGSLRLLQIKNGNTTENSSSNKIRTGTNIEKWYRRNTNSNICNWENFPDEEARKLLSEEGFQDFIREKMKTFK